MSDGNSVGSTEVTDVYQGLDYITVIGRPWPFCFASPQHIVLLLSLNTASDKLVTAVEVIISPDDHCFDVFLNIAI